MNRALAALIPLRGTTVGASAKLPAPTVVLALTPEIVVTASWLSEEDEAIADGGTLALGADVPNEAFVLTLTITNIGSIALTVTNPATIGALTNCTAAVDDAPSASIASGASTETTIDIEPGDNGAFSFTYSIANNDANENPYNFTVSGTAVDP